MSKLLTVYLQYIKNYYRSKSFFLMLFLIIIISAMMVYFSFKYVNDLPKILGSNALPLGLKIALFYFLWSLILLYIPVFASVFFGSPAISSEIENKTAFYIFPLPINRHKLFVGKFLAAFSVTLVIVLIYIIVEAATLSFIFKKPPEIYFYYSLVLLILFVLSMTSLTFMISAIFNKNTYAYISVLLIYYIVFYAGSLIEQPEFYGYLTSREILNFTGKIKGLKNEEIKSEIDRLSKITQISGFLDRKTGGYSRGMKQRLALSVALMGNPEIVVLDEPTFGLDPKGMSEIHSLIKEISRDKLVILSTHLLYEARDLCNRVIIINSGTIGHDSKTEENREMLKITLESDYNNDLDGNIHPFRVNGNEIILEKPPDMHNDDIINMLSRNGMHVKYVEKYDDLEEIYDYMSKKGIPFLKVIHKKY
ncbi:ABC transporter permease subunit [Acidiplasma sp.]|uniref:ATP-binding cassette domain-containing protein n=1 Tax=Acidiplasma sp. TaxID=1872114 RepID=UPI00258C9E17|nr:ABC transporter permease subunit [Acidiplasma sp.]